MVPSKRPSSRVSVLDSEVSVEGHLRFPAGVGVALLRAGLRVEQLYPAESALLSKICNQQRGIS